MSKVTRYPVELAFVAVIGGVFVYLLGITRETHFASDDWGLIRQAGTLRGIVEPYNDHLSLTILGIYRTLVEAFGFSYTPFRLVGLLCLLAPTVAYFVTTRRLLGPPLAALAALSMIGFNNPDLYPPVLNHCLALLGGILCAAALNRGRRADWVLAAALILSLSSAGGGVAVAAACLVHNACTRPPLRRWLAVLGPCAMWGCWWLVVARDNRSQLRPVERPSLSEGLRYARDIAWTPFDHLSAGLPVLGAVIAAAFIVFGLWRLREGAGEAANFLAWSTALGVWAVGLAYGRSTPVILVQEASDALFFRYKLLALAFVLLAVVPRRPIRWPEQFPLASDRRWLAASAVGVLAASWTVGTAIRSDVEYVANWFEGYGRISKGELLVLGLGTDVVPDDAAMSEGFLWYDLRAGQIRELLDRYGHPFESTRATVDRELVELGVAVARYEERRDLECRPLTGPIPWIPTGFRPLRLSSDQATWTVEVRRFGSEWVTIAEADAGEAVSLRLPALGIEEPWQVRADGACREA